MPVFTIFTHGETATQDTPIESRADLVDTLWDMAVNLFDGHYGFTVRTIDAAASAAWRAPVNLTRPAAVIMYGDKRGSRPYKLEIFRKV